MARLRHIVLQVASVLSLSGLAASDQAPPDNLGLENGYLYLETENFDVQLVGDAQVMVSLIPASGTFDFLPLDSLPYRADHGQYHWGDVTFRYRPVGKTAWIHGDSAAFRKPVKAVAPTANNTISTVGKVLAASDLTPTLSSASSNSSALRITRQWLDVDGDLALSFTLTNVGTASLEIGSLGFPAEFNSIFAFRQPYETLQICSLSDPYIGLHAGYIRVSPISGNGSALVVTPLGDTPLEAYRNLHENYTDDSPFDTQVFEAFYEWQTLSKAYAENEWKASVPWNTPTSRILEASKSLTFGLRFSLAQGGIKGIDDAVQATKTPYVRGIPGFIVPQDLTAQLLVNPGSGGSVSALAVEPSGALTVTQASPGLYSIVPSSTAFGRVRLTITYASGQLQTVHYYVTKPGPDTVANLGHFLTTEQYFNDTSDPFGRAPSVISYDYSAKAQVLQDDRVWIAGLSDEAGAGSFLAAAVKQAAQPNADEVAKLEAFVDGVLFKTIQPNDGNYSVRMSIFYYGLDGYNYSTDVDWGGSWNKQAAYSTDRAYDYVHVAATYWGLYRAGRAYPGLLTKHPWDWYLNQSYSTVMSVMAQNSTGGWQVQYSTLGLMGETVFGELLRDLKREGFTAKASHIEDKMRQRVTLWDSQLDPFGAENDWDSTGQEGIYYWSKYFGFTATAQKALGTVLGFQPTVAHWGWNGNARRYWDTIYGGKVRNYERQIHHYGSGLNALVALSAFRSSPNDTYLLRIGYGGMNGPLSNIHADGFASGSFHAWPSRLFWDPYSGDYGPNFLGLVLGTGTYLVEDKDLGLVAYGGLVVTGDTCGAVTVAPRDATRRRAFVGPLGLLVEIDAGVIQEFAYSAGDSSLSVTLGTLPGAPATSSATMWLSKEDGEAGYTVVGTGVQVARQGWQIPLGWAPVTVKVVPS